MALFRRRKNRAADAAAEPESTEELGLDPGDLGASRGPKDSGSSTVPPGYLDLGAVYVPRVPGLQLRGKFEADKQTLHRVLLVLGSSGVTVSVAAAPKSGGAWEILRGQIADSITNAGGQVEATEGPYGVELHAKIAATLPDGSTGYSPLRVIGVEGPRWIARLDIQGSAARSDVEATKACEILIDQLLINRGSEPKIRFEVLPLTLPKDAKGIDGV